MTKQSEAFSPTTELQEKAEVKIPLDLLKSKEINTKTSIDILLLTSEDFHSPF